MTMPEKALARTFGRDIDWVGEILEFNVDQVGQLEFSYTYTLTNMTPIKVQPTEKLTVIYDDEALAPSAKDD